MPFTLSHPAAILPIYSRWKKRLSLPPLVVGSLVPDAGYYVRMPDGYKENAHTFSGVFSFCLPVGIIALFLFYWIAPEITFLLPSPHREVLQPRIKVPASLRQVLMAIFGIILGAETHVLWDSFTHGTGWVVRQVPLLGEPLWGGRIPVYLALQYLSTVLGIVILLYAYDRWLKQLGIGWWVWQEPSWRFYLWLVVLGGCFVAAMIKSDTVRAIVNLYFLTSRHFALILITSCVSYVLAAVCVLSICVKLLNPRSLQDTAF
jgi:Domain of unknown function (DUF4184)